jgi:hypothetical protein
LLIPSSTCLWSRLKSFETRLLDPPPQLDYTFVPFRSLSCDTGISFAIFFKVVLLRPAMCPEVSTLGTLGRVWTRCGSGSTYAFPLAVTCTHFHSQHKLVNKVNTGEFVLILFDTCCITLDISSHQTLQLSINPQACRLPITAYNLTRQRVTMLTNSIVPYASNRCSSRVLLSRSWIPEDIREHIEDVDELTPLVETIERLSV